MGWWANLIHEQKQFKIRAEANEIINALKRKEQQLRNKGCWHVMPFLEDPSIENINNYQCSWCIDQTKQINTLQKENNHAN